MSTKKAEMVRLPTNSGGWVFDKDTSDSQRLVPRQGMLDELLRHGGLALPPPEESSGDGLIIMLRGKAGTGKSRLALQLAANLSRPPSSDPQTPLVRAFLSLEQDKEELKAISARMWKEQNSARKNLLPDVSSADVPSLGRARIRFNPDEQSEPHLREDALSRAHSFVGHFAAGIPRKDRPILFIDGLSILSEENRARLEMAALVEALRKRCLIGVIAYEPSRGVEESLDHQVDLVIELEEKHMTAPIDYVVHELHFKKSRYQEAALGWHQYKIRGYGLEIYPSVHFQVHSHLYMSSQLRDSLEPLKQKKDHADQVLEGVKPGDSLAPLEKKRAHNKNGDFDETPVEEGWSVVEQVLGGVKPGDSIALLGPRGAFKTALTLDFLFRSYGKTRPCTPSLSKSSLPAAAEVQHGLLVSIIDNEDTLRIHQACPLVKERRKPCPGFAECCKHAFLFYQRPGCIASAEFLYYLKTRLQIANPPIRRLAFWDLTQLEHRFPLLANDPMFIPALLDLFKIKLRPSKPEEKKTATPPEPERRVKSIFMGAANARLSTTVAAVADNVIFCWRDRVKRDVVDTAASMIGRIWKKTEQRGTDYLMIYVDRTSGGFAQERKNLHAFPILDGFQLYVPSGEWQLHDYAVSSDEVLFFEQSEGQILHVTAMQGFSSETG